MEKYVEVDWIYIHTHHSTILLNFKIVHKLFISTYNSKGRPSEYGREISKEKLCFQRIFIHFRFGVTAPPSGNAKYYLEKSLVFFTSRNSRKITARISTNKIFFLYIFSSVVAELKKWTNKVLQWSKQENFFD